LDLAWRLGLPIGLGFGNSLEGLQTGDQVILDVSDKALVRAGDGFGTEDTCAAAGGHETSDSAVDAADWLGGTANGAADGQGAAGPTSSGDNTAYPTDHAGQRPSKGHPIPPVATADGRAIMVRTEVPWRPSLAEAASPGSRTESVWLLPPDFDPEQAELPKFKPGHGPHVVLSIGDEVNLFARTRRFPSGYRIGAAIERPSLAAAADLVARQADFLYLNPGALGRACGGILHPGTLRLIQHVVRSARKAGTPVQIGGEAAADPLLLPLWLGLEITEWSLPEQALSDFRAHVRVIPWAWAREVGAAALRLSKVEDIGRYLEDAIGSRKSLRGLIRSSSGS
jgi:hypothetical protein